MEAGTDTLADVVDGGAGEDTVSFASIVEAAGVTFALGAYNAVSKSTAQTVAKVGAAFTNEVSKIENITGSKNVDVLTGNEPNNIINGGAGTDILTGGKGLDKLFGASGDGVKDVFDFNAPSESLASAMDLICDFVSGKDKIDLSGGDT